MRLMLLVAAATLAPLLGAQSLHSVNAAVSAPSAVLVELFTSEGCSSCPPADALLRQINGEKSPEGQLIVGISEHVTYWDRLGWKDPFSSDVFTVRQSAYGERFGLDSVYTPQMVVNGREQLVGSDRRSLQAALAAEAGRSHIDLRLDSAQIVSDHLDFRYSAQGLPSTGKLQLFAVLVDDRDESNVARGENSGRELAHVSVARMFVPVGTLSPTPGREISLPLPPSLQAHRSGAHHLILFAQQPGDGAILGVDTRPL